jgi:hypothetical protein
MAEHVYFVTYQVTQEIRLEAQSIMQAVQIVEQMDDAERAEFVHSQVSEVISICMNE